MVEARATFTPVWRGLISLAGLVLLTLMSGCSSVATRRGFYDPITAELRANHPDTAVQLLEAARQSNKFAEKDRFIYFLDAGMLNHYAGDFETSNDKLHLAESAAEELFTKSVSRAALSLLLNDNMLEYSGEDYEVLYANLIKALNYLELGLFEDAFVEIRRANLKLDQLEQKYADMARDLRLAAQKDTSHVDVDYEVDGVRFNNDAFARYLSMHLYAADGKLDDARIDYELLADAFHSQPHIYDFPMPEVMHQSEAWTVLSVVGLVGLAPVKEALNLRLRSDKDLKLVQILYGDTESEDGLEYGHLPIDVGEDFYFKFAIPKVVPRPSGVAAVQVLVDGRRIGELQLLEDVSKVAQETFNAKKSIIYIRTVARAVAKGLAAHRLKKKADTGGLGGWLKKAAIDVGMDITESADLRSSQYLPGRIFVRDFEIEPGTYDVAVQFFDTTGSLMMQTTYEDFEIVPGGLNLVRAVSVN